MFLSTVDASLAPSREIGSLPYWFLFTVQPAVKVTKEALRGTIDHADPAEEELFSSRHGNKFKGDSKTSDDMKS
eukprot:superscaffoldBa00011422_g25208